MAFLPETALRRELEGGRLAPVYLLFGNDAYLKKNWLQQIIRRVVPQTDCFNFQRFGSDCDLQEVYDAVQQLPLLADRKCVVLSDYDYEKADKTDFARLTTLLEEAVPSTVLVLVFDWVDPDLKRTSDRTKKLIAAAETGGGRAVCLNHRQTPELVRLLCDGAARRDCKLDSATARYLIETVSDDLNLLKSELEKLTAYCTGGVITRQDVDRVCIKTVERSVYDISRALLTGRLADALALLDDLFSLRVEPILILSVLSAAYVEIYKAMAAGDAGLRVEQVAAKLGYAGREFVLTRAAQSARRLDAGRVERSLNALLQTDTALKSTSADPRVLLEQLLVRLRAIAETGKDVA